MYPILYRFLRALKPGGIEIQQHMRELERMQLWTLPEIEVWQLRKLQLLVEYAYIHIPYYRELFKLENIHYKDIKSLKDFQALPFLTKDDINSNLDSMVSPNSKKLYPNQTGGSTGKPMRFFSDESLWRWNTANEFRGRRWYDVQPGAKIAWVWGAQQDMPQWNLKGKLKAHIKRERYLNAFSMTRAKMQSFAEMLVQWQPAMFRAYPSALYLFAQYLQEQGIDRIKPRLIETSAEKVTETQRLFFEEVFDCPVADCYASRELTTIAYQCKMAGLHVCETNYLEIIANGKTAEPGEMGQVVVTSLNQFAMPFIRYQIDDIGVYERGPCPCGRGLPTLREIVGRKVDFLVTDDGQFVHGEYFAYLFRVKPEVFRYQVYQRDRQHLEVRLICRKKVDATWLEGVRSEIQERFGPSMQISLQLVDDIQLTRAGKHRYIISEVKPNFS